MIVFEGVCEKDDEQTVRAEKRNAGKRYDLKLIFIK
jgi:hypothetical protein